MTDTVAEGLDVPWGIAFRASGGALVGERDRGRILQVTAAGAVSTLTELSGVDLTNGTSEGGLLGLALTEDESVLFAYYSTTDDNRIVQMSFDGTRAGTPSPILTGIPRGQHHNGGRLAIGPDGLLYATTGESGRPDLAQDKRSLGGKILRLTPAGGAAPGNPFDSPVWTWGHRNVEGIAFDARGRLWATEFGDQRYDELNLIQRGHNYGWPQTEGRTDEAGITGPKVTWTPDDCSPSGIAIVSSTAYIGALQGGCVFSVPLSGTSAGTPRAHLSNKYGRIRTVAAAPDKTLWVTTSNTDGRADPGRDDDRILRVSVST